MNNITNGFACRGGNKLLFLSLIIFLSLESLFATETIITNSNDVFRPLKNSAQSIANGDALVYDDTANPSGAFYGLFQIKCSLNTSQYYNNPKIQIYVQKAGDSWRKIAELTPPAKPASGDWTVSYIWNSRAASYEWTDTSPFKANLKIKFKLIEDN